MTSDSEVAALARDFLVAAQKIHRHYFAEVTALRQAQLSLGVAFGGGDVKEVLTQSEAVVAGAAVKVEELMGMVEGNMINKGIDQDESMKEVEEEVEVREEAGKEEEEKEVGDKDTEEEFKTGNQTDKVVDHQNDIPAEDEVEKEEAAADTSNIPTEEDKNEEDDDEPFPDIPFTVEEDAFRKYRRMSEMTTTLPEWIVERTSKTFCKESGRVEEDEEGNMAGDDKHSNNDDNLKSVDNSLCSIQFLNEADERFLAAIEIEEASMEDGVTMADESLEMAGNGLMLTLSEERLRELMEGDADSPIDGPFLLRMPFDRDISGSAVGGHGINSGASASREAVLSAVGADGIKLKPLSTAHSSTEDSSFFLEARLSLKLLEEEKLKLSLFPVLRLKRDVFTVTPQKPAFCVSTVDHKVSLEFRPTKEKEELSPINENESFSSSSPPSVRFGISIVSSDVQTMKDFAKTRPNYDGTGKGGEILATTPILDVEWLNSVSLSDWFASSASSDWLLEVTLPMPPNPAALKRAAEEKARKEEWIR